MQLKTVQSLISYLSNIYTVFAHTQRSFSPDFDIFLTFIQNDIHVCKEFLGKTSIDIVFCAIIKCLSLRLQFRSLPPIYFSLYICYAIFAKHQMFSCEYLQE